jgi:hypothetical protein
MTQALADPTYGMQCPHAERAMQFLTEIGIAVQLAPGASGFIEHVEVVNGGLRVDPRAPASALLHEAGHLAIVPTEFRHMLSGDLDAGMEKIFEHLDGLELEPDSHLQRAMLQTGDAEATAWAFAAGRAIGLPDELIIQDDEYSGEGRFIRKSLAAGAYVGINGISHAGFCVRRATPYRPLPVYPTLAYWLQHS